MKREGGGDVQVRTWKSSQERPVTTARVVTVSFPLIHTRTHMHTHIRNFASLEPSPCAHSGTRKRERGEEERRVPHTAEAKQETRGTPPSHQRSFSRAKSSNEEKNDGDGTADGGREKHRKGTSKNSTTPTSCSQDDHTNELTHTHRPTQTHRQAAREWSTLAERKGEKRK